MNTVLYNLRNTALLIVAVAFTARAQDVSINIISQENSVNDGAWAMGAPVGTTAILVTICNEDGGTTVLPSYKIRPLISVPSAIAQFAPDAQQTGLPAGWTILTNTGSSIRISNGTDQLPAAECRDIVLYVIPVAQGGPSGVTATIAFANGVAPGSTSGPQTTGNNPANDNSTTSIQITTPLPLILVSFEAERKGNTALLNWSTTEEINFDHFEIQRSIDGKDWEAIGNTSSYNESARLRQYSFTDRKPVNGRNYYRLKMIDRDETFDYSIVRTLDFGTGNIQIALYPNPAADQINVIADDMETIARVEIIDNNGKVVYDREKEHTGIESKISLKHFDAGNYVVRLTLQDGSVTSVKIVKY
jgi:hypothetical protein